MIASASDIRPGYVRGGLPAQIVRQILLGERTLENALTNGGNKLAQYVHYSQVAPETLVGFVTYPEHPREIIVVRIPFARQVVPTVILRPAEQDWEPSLQLLSKDYLLRHEAIIVRANWLDHLVNLAGTLENRKTRAFGVDKTLLAIGAAWERWESKGMTWKERAEDLARLTGLDEMTPNHLHVTCKRRGLVRRDNKAS